VGSAEFRKKRREQHQVIREEPSQHYRGLFAQLPRKDVGMKDQGYPGARQDYREGTE